MASKFKNSKAKPVTEGRSKQGSRNLTDTTIPCWRGEIGSTVAMARKACCLMSGG
ncbi:hypothetical protein NTGM5_160102 [Candidatus Nitrotoga sp. M5]|nr:hypothetical protein NTGM5_160102 [Candidatus Nitrotoga sp. M5]